MTFGFTSFQDRRYQVVQKLGEGGRGIVFLCQDTLLGRNVAVKVIKEEGFDPEGLLRFQREIQAMGRLVHLNVVTVYDIVREGAKHFLVLELMEGGDVDRLIGTSPHKGLDTATTVRIGKDVTQALEHAHRHGILHRDVKPGNIWLTREGHAKLGDFGLAYLSGDPRVTQAGMMVGSIAYMAPEVALGRQADARSDLYMLGVSLYEMSAGRVPFPGDDSVPVLFSHINDLPLPPHRFAPDIPEGLEALILRLLSKDPDQRPTSATEVLRALEEVERQLQAVPPPTGVPGTPQAAAARPPTPEPRFAQALVGRERELVLLRQRVDAALRGEGSLVFVTGEAGIGKTRLAWEIRAYARGRGILWLEGHYAKEGSIPSQPWVEAIRTFLVTASPALLEKVLLPYGADLSKLVPEVSERLGPLPSLPRVNPEEERARRFEALAGFFREVAREQPLALFLDDLQWAPSLDTLHHIARSVVTERLLLLATYRDAELKENPTLAKTVLALNRERLFHPLPLKRLGEGEVAKMVAQTLGEVACAKVAEVVYQKTEGNPFFVEEVVRYLIESGAISLGEKSWDVKDPTLVQVPDSVKAVVGERLERLGEEASGLLAWASVVGREFTLPLLKEMAGLEEEKLLEVVDTAVAARVLTPRLSLGREAYAFVDHQIRDVLYEGIGPARRCRFHLKVAHALEQVHARRLEEQYDALAHHFLEGNNLQKAAEYSVKAADRASSVNAWERAMAHYQTALELLQELDAGPRQQAEVVEKLARVTRLGKGKGALGYWEKALSLYESLGDNKKAGAIHHRLAQQYLVYEVGAQDWEKAYEHGLKSVTLLEPQGETSQLARVQALLGYCAAHRSEPVSKAIPLLEKALTLADRLGDAVGVRQAAVLLGVVLVDHAGEVKRGLELVHKSWEGARERNDPVVLSEVAGHLSLCYARLRDAEAALQWAEQAVDASKQSGTFRHQILSTLFLAWASILRGDIPRALLSLETAQQVARKGGIEVSQWSHPAIIVPGLVHFFLGDWDKGETELLQCLQTGKQTRFVDLTFNTAPVLGRLYLERGDLVRAKTHLQEAVTISEPRGEKTFEIVLRALLAEVASQGGELEEAAAHLRRAQDILSQGQDWRGLVLDVYLAEGALTTAERHWQEAHEAFQKAVEISRQYHLPYEEARSLFGWGRMYLSRGGPGDRERGMELLDHALAIFQRIQARKMVEKVLARKQVLGA